MITVHLPGWNLVVEHTGERKRIHDIEHGGLFEFENQVWEKLPQSMANLSDLNDESEIMGNPMVEVLKELTLRQDR